MKHTLFAVTLAAALAMGGAASAADLSGGYKDTPAYAAVETWTGAYAGISGGVGISSPYFGNEYAYASGYSPDQVGGLVGGTLGYNWQIRNLVLGVEGDLSWTTLNAKNEWYNYPGEQSYNQSNIDAIGTLRLRAGYAIGSNLFYLTGGVAFLDASHKSVDYGEACSSGYSACSNTWHTGFAVGAGYEAMLADHLSFKAEYLFVETPTENICCYYDTDYNANFSDSVQIARVGLNYKFTGSIFEPLK